MLATTFYDEREVGHVTALRVPVAEPVAAPMHPFPLSAFPCSDHGRLALPAAGGPSDIMLLWTAGRDAASAPGGRVSNDRISLVLLVPGASSACHVQFDTAPDVVAQVASLSALPFAADLTRSTEPRGAAAGSIRVALLASLLLRRLTSPMASPLVVAICIQIDNRSSMMSQPPLGATGGGGGVPTISLGGSAVYDPRNLLVGVGAKGAAPSPFNARFLIPATPCVVTAGTVCVVLATNSHLAMVRVAFKPASSVEFTAIGASFSLTRDHASRSIAAVARASGGLTESREETPRLAVVVNDSSSGNVSCGLIHLFLREEVKTPFGAPLSEAADRYHTTLRHLWDASTAAFCGQSGSGELALLVDNHTAVHTDGNGAGAAPPLPRFTILQFDRDGSVSVKVSIAAPSSDALFRSCDMTHPRQACVVWSPQHPEASSSKATDAAAARFLSVATFPASTKGLSMDHPLVVDDDDDGSSLRHWIVQPTSPASVDIIFDVTNGSAPRRSSPPALPEFIFLACEGDLLAMRTNASASRMEHLALAHMSACSPFCQLPDHSAPHHPEEEEEDLLPPQPPPYLNVCTFVEVYDSAERTTAADHHRWGSPPDGGADAAVALLNVSLLGCRALHLWHRERLASDLVLTALVRPQSVMKSVAVTALVLASQQQPVSQTTGAAVSIQDIVHALQQVIHVRPHTAASSQHHQLLTVTMAPSDGRTSAFLVTRALQSCALRMVHVVAAHAAWLAVSSREQVAAAPIVSEMLDRAYRSIGGAFQVLAALGPWSVQAAVALKCGELPELALIPAVLAPPTTTPNATTSSVIDGGLEMVACAETALHAMESTLNTVSDVDVKARVLGILRRVWVDLCPVVGYHCEIIQCVIKRCPPAKLTAILQYNSTMVTGHLGRLMTAAKAAKVPKCFAMRLVAHTLFGGNAADGESLTLEDQIAAPSLPLALQATFLYHTGLLRLVLGNEGRTALVDADTVSRFAFALTSLVQAIRGDDDETEPTQPSGLASRDRDSEVTLALAQLSLHVAVHATLVAIERREVSAALCSVGEVFRIANSPGAVREESGSGVSDAPEQAAHLFPPLLESIVKLALLCDGGVLARELTRFPYANAAFLHCVGAELYRQVLRPSTTTSTTFDRSNGERRRVDSGIVLYKLLSRHGAFGTAARVVYDLASALRSGRSSTGETMPHALRLMTLAVAAVQQIPEGPAAPEHPATVAVVFPDFAVMPGGGVGLTGPTSSMAAFPRTGTMDLTANGSLGAAASSGAFMREGTTAIFHRRMDFAALEPLSRSHLPVLLRRLELLRCECILALSTRVDRVAWPDDFNLPMVTTAFVSRRSTVGPDGRTLSKATVSTADFSQTSERQGFEQTINDLLVLRRWVDALRLATLWEYNPSVILRTQEKDLIEHGGTEEEWSAFRCATKRTSCRENNYQFLHDAVQQAWADSHSDSLPSTAQSLSALDDDLAAVDPGSLIAILIVAPFRTTAALTKALHVGVAHCRRGPPGARAPRPTTAGGNQPPVSFSPTAAVPVTVLDRLLVTAESIIASQSQHQGSGNISAATEIVTLSRDYTVAYRAFLGVAPATSATPR